MPSTPGETRPIDTVADLEHAIRSPDASVVYRGSGRRLSAQQIEAAHRRLMQQERREHALVGLERMQAEYADLLNCWRDMPTVPTPDTYRLALTPQPFEYDRSRPAPPDLPLERSILEDEVSAQVAVDLKATFGEQALPAVILVGGLATAGGLWGALAAQEVALGVSGLGLLGSLTTTVFARIRRHRAIAQETTIRMPAAWEQREDDLQRRHEASVRAFHQSRDQAESEWLALEAERIDWATRLVDGDPTAIEEAVAASFGDLDFPFESAAAFALDTEATGYIHLDLPEIEDVIPTTRYRVLKDGRLKEAKRPKVDQNADYAQLACGVGLMLAATAFATAPTLRVLHVAAYTQRKQRGSDATADDYVYTATIRREQAQRFTVDAIDAVAFISTVPGCLKLQSNMLLKKLGPRDLPSWVEGFQSAGEQGRPGD